MTEVNQSTDAGSQGLSIASLILGIAAIITSAIWFMGITLGILAIIFGIISVKHHGRKKAIAGMITGGVGIVLSLVVIAIVFMALPALQRDQRDTARRNDVVTLGSEVLSYQTENRGRLPAATDLMGTSLLQVTSISDGGEPTKDSAEYRAGENCDGVSSERAYAVTVLLESGAMYCQGS